MNEHILKAARDLPLHDPARMALLDAYKQIVELKQALCVAADQRDGVLCPECKVDVSHNWDCPYYAIEKKAKEAK